MVMVLPMYEIVQAGLYYNTAAVIDADGTLPRQVPQAAHPAGQGLLGEVLLPPRQRRVPDLRHRGRQGRRVHLLRPPLPRGLAGARPQRRRDRVQPVGHPPRPVRVPLAARAAGRGGRQHVLRRGDQPGRHRADSATTTSTARATSSIPRASSSATSATPYKPELIVRDLDLDKIKRGPRPLGVLPRPPPRRLRRARRSADDRSRATERRMARILIKNGTVVIARRGRGRPATCSIDGETIAAVLGPRAGFAVAGGSRRPTRVDRRHRQVRHPRRHRRAHPHGAARSAARSRPTRSRPARSPRRGAASRRSSTSPCSAPARTCTTASPSGTRKADGNCAIDYAFHQIIGGVDEESLKAMTYLIDNEGITSFKLFMAYPGVFYSDDGQILRAMQTAGECGAMIMMHAENGIAIDVLVAQALARGETDPKYHSLTRPGRARGRGDPPGDRAGQGRRQRAAVHRPHVGVARRSRRSPRRATRAATCSPRPARSTSTCRSRTTLGQPGFEGAKWVCSTPLRSQARQHHHADLWKGLRMNELAVVSTDHCPFCMKDQKELGLGDFSKIPNGIGGVEHRMELIYQGVVNGEISLERWVETCCTTPARMFGMYPTEGRHRPRRRRRRRRLGPERADQDRRQRQAPHEHGPLGVGGLRDRRQGRHRASAAARSSSRTTRSSGAKGHGQFVKRGLSPVPGRESAELAMEHER